jgi:transposase, IS5 family
LYALSDDQAEYQLKDRWSFTWCVGLALHDLLPEAKTISLFREQLASHRNVWECVVIEAQ